MATLTPTVQEQVEIARENLRLALAIRDRKAAQVSRAAGLSVNTLANFINGKVAISYPHLLAICETLNVPIGIIHHPTAITPQRLKLQSILSDLPTDELGEIARELEAENAPSAP